jgi:hypothetical protein
MGANLLDRFGLTDHFRMAPPDRRLRWMGIYGRLP